MLTICLLLALAVFAIVFACTAGMAASIMFVLFGDVFIAILIAVCIIKLHKHFKKKKRKTKKNKEKK